MVIIINYDRMTTKVLKTRPRVGTASPIIHHHIVISLMHELICRPTSDS